MQICYTKLKTRDNDNKLFIAMYTITTPKKKRRKKWDGLNLDCTKLIIIKMKLDGNSVKTSR